MAGGNGTGVGSGTGAGIGADDETADDSKFVQIKNMRDAGIGVEQTPRWLYRRAAFDELSEFVGKMVERGHIGLIEGLPGTGKSSTLWWKLQELDKKLLWIHLDQNGQVVNIVKVNFADSKIERATQKPKTVDAVLENLNQIRVPNYDELEILVIDGVHQDKYGVAISALRSFAMDKLSERCGFLTMSNKIRREHKHQLDIFKAQQENGEFVAQFYFTQYSWTLQEYLSAFVKTDGSATELFAQILPAFEGWGVVDITGKFPKTSKRHHDVAKKHISVEEVATQKYVYAGGSARWMMSETKQSIDDMIQDYLTECIRLDALVDFTLGEGSPFAKTHLYASSKDDSGRPVYSLVSQRATILALKSLGAAGTKSLYQHAIRLKNPSFLVGWLKQT